MSKNSKFEDSLNFVSKYFQPYIFSKNRKDADFYSITGKKRIFNIFTSTPRKIAAASITVALVASASCLIYLRSTDKQSAPVEINTPVEQTEVIEVQNQYTEYAVIDFSDAPLKEVIEDIEKTYGVKISNIPSESHNLTLHYEGDATELISIINDLLDINLRIENTQD